jgi:peptidyl-dipeptidase A
MKFSQYFVSLSLSVLALVSCQSSQQQAPDEAAWKFKADSFLVAYNKEYQALVTRAGEAQWASNIKIVEGDSTNAIATRKAEEATAAFTGSTRNIEMAKLLLTREKDLFAIQVKQLKSILYKAANNPETVPDLVKRRIKAETAQTEKMFGFDFKLNGKSVSANDIDEALKKENNLEKRLAVWNTSKEVGKGLKSGLIELRDLRNQTVQALGYKDYFEYQVSDYGMSTSEMMDMLRKLNKELYPLYRELHTYARYELAKKYNQKVVPDMIPAHWLSNRWGQDWSEMVTVEGFDLDAVIRQKDAKWVVEQGEKFYTSLGFDPLPKSFWDKSDLYPAPADATYKKNNHASAWHVDLDKDVRSLMSVLPNAEWYETSHHELGHIYYYMSYSRPEIPVLLREGANRAYHEALGSLMGFAAMQQPFLEGLGLVKPGTKIDQTKQLLKEALNYVVFIPFATGVMGEFEHSLYTENLSPDQFNAKWWEVVGKYQGIAAPEKRGEEYCDAATKTHINDDAAQYYDYALSYVLLFQVHQHIANNILKQDPHATNYYGNKEVGKFIANLMKPGATGDWRKLLFDATGSDLSAQPMVDYFAPLMEYLKEQNKGRVYTLAELK